MQNANLTRKGIFMKNKIYKVLSIALTLLIVFSACLCMFNSVSAATEKTYYISSTGDDSKTGAAPRNAVATVAKAIELGKDAGLTTGDTVTLKVLDSVGAAWDASTTGPIYLPTHDFKLIITSNSNDASALIGTGNRNVNFGGDVDFKNIKVNFGSSYCHICSNGHNITFDQNCIFQGNKQMGYYTIGSWSGDSIYNNDFTFNTEIPITKIYVGNFYSSPTFNGDVNINYNSLSGAPTFTFGSSNGTAKFEAGVNFTLNAASAAFGVFTGGNASFGDNSYVQVLNNTASVLSASDAGLSSVPADKLWVYNSKLRAADLITLTDTKGKLAVNTAVYSNVKATDVSNPNNVINEQGGFLTLPAGVYDITAEKIPQQVTYYVKKDGTGDGKTPEAPVATIAAAINKAIADGNIVGDTVTVKAIGTEVPLGEVGAYPFDLIVDSNDPAVRTKIDCSGVSTLAYGGETIFRNVEIYKSGQWSSLQLNSTNVTFEASVKFNTSFLAVAFGASNGNNNSNTNIPGQTVVMNCATTHQTFLTNFVYADRTYTEPLTYIVDNADAAPNICFNAYSGGIQGNTYYNKAVNLGIYSAKEVKFSYLTNAHIGEALQIINGSATDVNSSDPELARVPSDKLYVLNNISGDSKLLEFTDTVGKFKVNLVNPEHRLVVENAQGVNIPYDNSGFVTLPAGVYKVSIERDPYFVDYYVDPEGIEVLTGTRPATAGTKENPVRTFADATRLISQDGLSKMDVATVHLKTDVRNFWRNENQNDATYNINPANYNCTVIIDSYVAGTVTELYSYNAISLSGDLVLRNVDFKVEYQWADSNMGSHNLTIDKSASLTCAYLFTWKTEYDKLHTADQTLRVDGVLTTSYIGLAAPYHNHKSTGDFNFYFNNPNSACALMFGPRRDGAGPNVYEGNININIKQAKTFTLETSDMGAEINGSLQALIDDSVMLPYSVKTNFENFEVAGGKWYITNAATDDDFVSFANKGVLAVKNGATAYTRQLGKDQVKHTGGTIDLSAAPGAYTVSNKKIAPLTDDSHKMLYFLTGSTTRFLGTRAKVTPGETYVFEYSIYCNFYEDCKPRIKDDGDRGQTCEVEIISEKKIGDCYRIVCKGTIPDDYNCGSTAFFGVDFTGYSEGIIFDRTVYNINDSTKKDCFEGNQNFHDGLDYVSLNYLFWGAIFTDSRGGRGLVRWQNGLDQLEVMNYDLNKIAEIKALNNPDDGEWWDKDDIKEEEIILGKANVKGKFIYQDGTPIPGAKMLLVGDTDTLSDTTDSSGKFSFNNIPVGFYELYVSNGTEQFPTTFSAFVFDGDTVEFTVVNDISGIGSNDGTGENGDGTGNENNEPTDTPEHNSKLEGTVYTSDRQIVKGLKIVLKGVGEVVTDENGSFGFANIPAGNYEIFAVSRTGTETKLRDVKISENSTLTVKLLYNPPVESDTDEVDNGWIIWVIIASVVALIVVAALIFFVILRKKKK